jgi:hypothetical protein
MPVLSELPERKIAKANLDNIAASGDAEACSRYLPPMDRSSLGGLGYKWHQSDINVGTSTTLRFASYLFMGMLKTPQRLSFTG